MKIKIKYAIIEKESIHYFTSAKMQEHVKTTPKW